MKRDHDNDISGPHAGEEQPCQRGLVSVDRMAARALQSLDSPEQRIGASGVFFVPAVDARHALARTAKQ